MFSLRRATTLALATLLVTASACGGPTPAQGPENKETTPASSASASETTPAPAKTAAAPESKPAAQDPAGDPPLPQAGPPVVTVLDPGAEPRKPLRYAFQKKAESVEIDMKMSMAMSAAGRASPMMAMPTIRMVMEIKPQSVDPDGTMTASVETKKVEVMKDHPLPKDAMDKLTKDMQAIVGMKGKAVVTSRGLTKEASIDAPPNASPQVKQILDSMKDSLRDMSMPLPEEAVGKNAKWEVKTVLTTQLTTVQKATYTVKDVTDKSVALDASVSQAAPPQKITSQSNLPPGATLHLDSHTGTGSGTVKLSFDRMTPSSTMKMQSKSMMTVSMGDEKQALGTDVAMELSIKPTGAK